MVITKRFPSHYYAAQDFPLAMTVVVLVLLTISLTVTEPHHGSSVDLPRVANPTSMPRADWDNSMVLAIMRDGTMYFGQNKVNQTTFSTALRDRLRTKDVERRVYIKADARTMTGSVNDAIDVIHNAGIERIAFMVDQRKANCFRDVAPPAGKRDP